MPKKKSTASKKPAKDNKKTKNKPANRPTDKLANSLNSAQKEAVTHGDGPLLIIAGAGTGKTSVITNRIAHLILDKKVNTDAVLALTFTEKAAGEMIERVDKMMPMGYVDLWISTFHAFCEKILKQHALDIGLPNDFTLLNQTAQWLLVRKNLDRFKLDYYKPLGNPTKFIHGLLSHFSRCKDEEITATAYTEYAHQLANRSTSKLANDLDDEPKRVGEIASAYETYQQLILENDALDFGDLINYTLKLFKERPAILKKYQEQFKYILVDEFQDTNFAQYQLVKLLAGEQKNLTVVGDDDQSIYKFRGASVSNILQFKNDFADTKQVVLTENYRSAQDILDLSYNFIKLNNPNRLEAQSKTIDKRLTANAAGKGTIQHLHFSTIDDEVLGVLKKIVEIKKKDPEASWGDFAILVRANDSAAYFTNVLRKTDLPHHYVALKGLYGKPIILDIVNYLKLLDNYHESASLFRILRSPVCSLTDEQITALNHFASKKSISLYEALKRAGEVEGLFGPAVSEINELLAMIAKHTALSREKTVGEVLLAFLTDSKYLEKILHLDEEQVKKNTDYLDQLYKRVKTFEESTLDPSLRNFMDELDLELESGESGSLAQDAELGPDTIKIMTVHSAKGLEFKYVFLPQLVEQRFPTIARSEPIKIPEALIKETLPEGDMHLEEERRLFYVAMTRAKRGLFVTSAEDYGGARKKKVSRFLVELEETSPSFKLDAPARAEKKEDRIKQPTTHHQPPTKPRYPLPKAFSYSQIAAFTTCPYQYKLAFIYKIPTLGKGQFSYGKTMHSVLQELFVRAHARTGKGQSDLFSIKPTSQRANEPTSQLANEPTSQLANEPTSEPHLSSLVPFEELLQILAEKWIDDWYESPQQREKYQDKARASLKLFYDSVKDRPLTVRQLEKPFTLKMVRDASQLDTIYSIRGVIDRIDVLPDGTAEIIDYKTGTPKETLTADDKRQLLLYQMACEELPVLTDGAKVQKLTFHYLDNNSQLSFVGSEKELDKIRETFVSAIEEIKDSKFEATPDPYKCKFCDFKNICEFKIL